MRKLVWLGLVVIATMCSSCKNLNIGKSKTIKLEKSHGVYTINCLVNSIPMSFVFDTGAADVSMSAVEAMFLVKSGLLVQEDILGKVAYKTATGSIDSCTTFLIKRLEINGIVLENVRASVQDGDTAPLLLGQSAIKKLGAIIIDFDKQTIIVLDLPKTK